MELSNQYPPLMGVPELRQAVARHSLKYSGLEVDWQTETLITVGATEALAAAFLGLLNEGDEVLNRGGHELAGVWVSLSLSSMWLWLTRRARGLALCRARGIRSL